MTATEVFHYTSISSATQILGSGQLWATHFRYLNDTKEVEFGLDVLREGLRMLRDDRRYDGVPRDLLDPDAQHHVRANKYLAAGPFVTCFSQEPDSLSLWRAYGRGATSPSCAIGFAAAQLGQPLVDVNYVPAGGEAEAVLAAGLAPSLDALARTGDAPLDTRKYYYAQALLGPERYKHPAFQDEKEVRVVLPIGRNHPTDLPLVDDLRFHPSNLGLTPFVSWGFQRLAVLSIVLGPSPHQELEREALSAWLEASGYPEVGVHMSAAPFRDW